MKQNIDITSLVRQTVIKVKNDADGLQFIADLRKQAKAENAKSRAKATLDESYEPVFVRVVIFGRLGKNNPNSWIYKQRNSGYRNGYQRIENKHAAELAVYINPVVKSRWGSFHISSNFKFVK